MADPYFSERAQARTVLVWVAAVRLQLDRWETLIAKGVRLGLQNERLTGEELWRTQIELHFAVVAGRQLVRAIRLSAFEIEVDDEMAAELTAKRDLLEHWDENMPIFNVTPRPREPEHRSGKSWAARNPTSTPYGFFRWSSDAGPLLTPHVPASAVRELVDRAESAVLEHFPEMADYVPAEAPSPWGDEWWPTPT